MPSLKSSEILFIPSFQRSRGFTMMGFALEVTRVQRTQTLSPNLLLPLFLVMVHKLAKRQNHI